MLQRFFKERNTAHYISQRAWGSLVWHKLYTVNIDEQWWAHSITMAKLCKNYPSSTCRAAQAASRQLLETISDRHCKLWSAKPQGKRKNSAQNGDAPLPLQFNGAKARKLSERILHHPTILKGSVLARAPNIMYIYHILTILWFLTCSIQLQLGVTFMWACTDLGTNLC